MSIPPSHKAREAALWVAGSLLISAILVVGLVFILPHRSNQVSLGDAVTDTRRDQQGMAGPRGTTQPEEPPARIPATEPQRSTPRPARTVTAVKADEEPEPASLIEPFLSDRPRVEVVFCLDTTGSMGSLLEGAKQKIWSISNQILTGRPTPELRVGLLAYRDRGANEEYLTRLFDITEDLDAIGGELKGLAAAGGGDFPESVNQALDESLNRMKWSSGRGTLRIIFLVGDAPPHMDYPDDVKYPLTCKKATERGVLINTIQCGNNGDCRKHWQEIAKLSGGKYVEIAATGGVTLVTTPFDDRLVAINRELAKSILVYGDSKAQADGRRKADQAASLTVAFGAADRAAYSARNRRVAAYDLLDNIRDKKVRLGDLTKDQLPRVLRDLSDEKRQAYLDRVQKQREELWSEALELDRKRTDHLLEGETNKAFDNQVLQMLREQASRYRIHY